MKKFALNVAGLFFTAVTIIHIVRYVKAWPIMINGFTVPLNWSISGAFITGILAIWMFTAACR